MVFRIVVFVAFVYHSISGTDVGCPYKFLSQSFFQLSQTKKPDRDLLAIRAEIMEKLKQTEKTVTLLIDWYVQQNTGQ